MRKFQALGDAGGDVKCIYGVQRLPRPDAPRQAAPLVIGHHKIRPGGTVGDFQHRNDVGMFELLQVARLLDETMEYPGVRDPFRPDHLDGHAAAGRGVARQKHHAHAAAAEHALDFKLLQRAQQPRTRRRREHLLRDQFRNRAAQGRDRRMEGRRQLGRRRVVGLHGAVAPPPDEGAILSAAWRSNCWVSASSQGCWRVQSRPRRNSASESRVMRASRRTRASAMLV